MIWSHIDLSPNEIKMLIIVGFWMLAICWNVR